MENLGPGTYRVNKGATLIYRGQEYSGGDTLLMSAAGAGAHHKLVTRVSEAEIEAERAAKKSATKSKSKQSKRKDSGPDATTEALLAIAKAEGATDEQAAEFAAHLATLGPKEREEMLSEHQKRNAEKPQD